MSSSDKTLQVLHGIQIISGAAILGYMAVEYLWPVIRRKFGQSDLQRRLQLTKSISLNRHEEELASNALHPSCIQETLSDIGGTEDIIERMLQITQLLLRPSSLKGNSRLLHPPTGILLYGPPGCGKTILVRALAKQAGIRFLPLPLDILLDKWVGETEKYIAALFSLAHKISPVIIFIDEIDSVTRKRGTSINGTDWSASMKSQLLTLWDGVASRHQPQSGIIIVGATNRPQDIDEAFLRRMPLQLKVDLPGHRERLRILEIFMNDLGVDLGESEREELARQCNGMSGSDLREVMRRAGLRASLSINKCDISFGDIQREIEILAREMSSCRVYN